MWAVYYIFYRIWLIVKYRKWYVGLIKIISKHDLNFLISGYD